jgi:branched-chain amino acid transport system ATP-binding protein
MQQPNNPKPILEVQNLETVYHGVMRVLRGISLVVPQGGVVALLGPNGAGKTTTLRAITGLLALQEGEITKGTIRFFGENLKGIGAPSRVGRGMAQVMEGRRIFPELTVEENLQSGAWGMDRNDTTQRIEAAYQRFPILGKRRSQPAGYLSGGEQQMLAISRSLMSNPKLLVLDEPSLGLAPKIVGDVIGLIKEIHQQGVSILLVEQNASVAMELADYVYIMENGKLVRDGTPEELREDEDIKEFYLGIGGEKRTSYREIKHYRRRKRWLS